MLRALLMTEATEEAMLLATERTAPAFERRPAAIPAPAAAISELQAQDSPESGALTPAAMLEAIALALGIAEEKLPMEDTM